MMDPFDEFEFKPLTDGLGFHKKSMNLKEGLSRSGVVEDELQGIPISMPGEMSELARRERKTQHSFEAVLSALEKTPLKRSKDLQFTEPLPRDREVRQGLEIEMPRAPVQSPFPQPDAYKRPNLKIPDAPPDTVGVRRGAADSPVRKLSPASVSFAAAGLDGIIVMALAIIFLIALMMVTKVDMASVLINVDKDHMTQACLFVLFVAVMQMYVIVARSFFGQTLGEWTFDLQLGRDEEQASESYPLRIALRCLLNTVTGLVLLPLLSAMLGRDVAGQFSGVQLYRQRV